MTTATLFIGGTWSAASTAAPGTSAARPTASRPASCPKPHAYDAVRAVAAARAAFDGGEWAGVPALDAVRSCCAWPRCSASARRLRPRRDAGHRQAPGGERNRHGRHRQLLRVLRQDRGPGLRPARGRRQQHRGQPDRVRTRGRVRVDRALELPAAPGRLEDRPGARGGLQLCAQAQRAHTPHRDPDDGHPGRARPACGRGQPRAGRRQDRADPCCRATRTWTWCRSPADWKPARRIAALGGRHGQEGGAGAGRQEPQHRFRGRRLRRRRWTMRSTPRSSTPARSAPPARASWSRSPSPNGSWTSWCAGRGGSAWAGRSTTTPRPGR